MVRSPSRPIRRVGTLLSTSLRDGVPVEVVSKLLGHSSVAVTSAVYGHLTAADARKALEAAGWFAGSEVSL
jgi:integrase/recombinase XerD